MTLILNNDDVQKALDPDECLGACEDGYRELAANNAVNRPTSQSYLPHSLPRSTYSFKSVEGGIGKLRVMALRITSDIVKEEEVSGTLRLNKLPLAGKGQFVGMVQLFSTETGEPLAIMPDGLIQQARVAVTSALGVKFLARKDCATLGLIGTGDQAHAHFRALTKIRPIKKVKVFSPTPAHREEFAKEMERESGIEVKPTSSVAETVAQCDLVCTATNASRPIITGTLLEPGMHYNAIREFEIDETVFSRSDVVAIHTRFGGSLHYLPPHQEVDLPGVRREKPRDWSLFPEISDVVSGRSPTRENDKQITFFLNNIGTGVQFAAVGFSVYRRAQQLGLGKEVPTDWFLQDIKP
ncbi:MAG: ornithine cyclodeaminase family protein [Deltaproteobacteria bacterium]|nr:ornithine cyclodeaminase family protein [Deltaproteobacteria bacterium]